MPRWRGSNRGENDPDMETVGIKEEEEEEEVGVGNVVINVDANGTASEACRTFRR